MAKPTERTQTLLKLKDHYKTVKATAEAMGISKTTCRRWLKDGVPDHSPMWPTKPLSSLDDRGEVDLREIPGGYEIIDENATPDLFLEPKEGGG